MEDLCAPVAGGLSGGGGSSLIVPVAAALILLFGGAIFSLVSKRRQDEEWAPSTAAILIVVGALIAGVTLAVAAGPSTVAASANNAAGDDPCTAALGDRVWIDADADGVQDADEPGFPDLRVILIDADGEQLADATTDTAGRYAFTGLAAGLYQLVFPSEINGLVISPRAQGGDPSADSDPESNGQTPYINLAAAAVDNSIDAGYQPEGGPLPLPIAPPTSSPPTTQPATTTSSSSTTTTTTTRPPTVSRSTSTTTTIPSPITTTTTSTPATTTTSPATVSTAPPTTAPATTIEGVVWLDNDGDGRQGSDEPGLGQAIATLRSTDGDDVATATTGSAGRYSLAVESPGTYTVCFDAGGRTPTAPDVADADPGCTAPITVDAGSAVTDVDAGFEPRRGSIGNLVWLDLDGDASQRIEEPGVQGITVELLDDTGSSIDATTSDAAGRYRFDNLLAGTYSVCFFDPLDRSASSLDADDDRLDSDADPDTGCTADIELAEGQVEDTIDAGFEPLVGRIGDRVWLDIDENGTQGPGEPGVSGVVIHLFDGDGAFVTDATTRSGGSYLLDGLAPGDYSVCFFDPPGRRPTIDGVGGASIDSDLVPTAEHPDYDGCAGVTLAEGADVYDIDAGYVPFAGRIGDLVWLDLDENGVAGAREPGISGITVDLYSADRDFVGRATTNQSGSYLFDGIAPGEYTVCFFDPDARTISDTQSAPTSGFTDYDGCQLIELTEGDSLYDADAGYAPLAASSVGDLVWIDLNRDGRVSAGEPGLGGVRVELFDETAATIEVVTSDTRGSYRFDRLLPGQYSVCFSDPAGRTLTVAGATNGTDGCSEWFELGERDANLGIDAGFAPIGGD